MGASPSAEEKVYWAEFAVFVAAALLGILIGYVINPPLTLSKRLKLLLALAVLFLTAVPHGAFAQGQGEDTRADGHDVRWGRWVVNTICQAPLLALFIISITDSWMRGIAIGLVGSACMATTIFATESVSGAQIYWWAWSLGPSALLGFFVLFAVHAPERTIACKGLPSWKVWLLKIGAALFSIWAYPCLYIATSSWKDAFPEKWGEALTMFALDIVSRIVLLAFAYEFVDACVEEMSVADATAAFLQNPGAAFGAAFGQPPQAAACAAPLNGGVPSTANVAAALRSTPTAAPAPAPKGQIHI